MLTPFPGVQLSLIGTSRVTRARCHVTSNIYNNAISTIIYLVSDYNSTDNSNEYLTLKDKTEDEIIIISNTNIRKVLPFI